MYQLMIFLSLLIVPLVSPIRMRRQSENSQLKVDKFIEYINRGLSVQAGSNIIDFATAIAPKHSLRIVDLAEDIDDAVYTVESGRQVRRRRSVGTGGSGAESELKDGGIVTLGDLKTNVAEVKALFQMVMDKVLDGSSPSKKLQLKVLGNEMNLRIEKLVRNIKRMEADEAGDQEMENRMKLVEESHTVDLPSGYMR
eukprot:GFUD01028762.1.p1 GENE.GFUD01028762.1~~GFUD01028762.1.p1  ORF type:complete len:197 (-),score=50.89 GFUD01028762.1:152-742(-)